MTRSAADVIRPVGLEPVTVSQAAPLCTQGMNDRAIRSALPWNRGTPNWVTCERPVYFG
jgi:hypothetical protein